MLIRPKHWPVKWYRHSAARIFYERVMAGKYRCQLSAMTADKFITAVVCCLGSGERVWVRYGCSRGSSLGTDLLSHSMGFIHRSCCRSPCQLLVVRHMLLPTVSEPAWHKLKLNTTIKKCTFTNEAIKRLNIQFWNHIVDEMSRASNK